MVDRVVYGERQSNVCTWCHGDFKPAGEDCIVGRIEVHRLSSDGEQRLIGIFCSLDCKDEFRRKNSGRAA